jgi:hypothetical protein
MKKASVLAAGFALAFGLAVGGCPHANTADTVSVQTARFQSLAADGGDEAGAYTTALTLTFDKAVDGLSAADIALTDSEGTGITKDDLVAARPSKAGYTFTPETRPVQVHAGVIETQFRSLTAVELDAGLRFLRQVAIGE